LKRCSSRAASNDSGWFKAAEPAPRNNGAAGVSALLEWTLSIHNRSAACVRNVSK
jgi:hypothetical protein